MANVTNTNGKAIDFEASIEHMDDEIRDAIANYGVEMTEQQFFSEYESIHADKFGEEWELSKANPVW